MPPDGPSEPFPQARQELHAPAPRTAESARSSDIETWFLIGQKARP
jgi:hypothetical protein